MWKACQLYNMEVKLSSVAHYVTDDNTEFKANYINNC